MEEPFIKIHKWLYPLSWLYGAAVSLRNKLFDWEILRSKSFDVPVICIGNIAVGGTGKTPHTEYLIKLLHQKFPVAVLSRGYKRHSKGFVLSNETSTVQNIGDEPFQIKSKFPTIQVAVDENRCHGIERLLTLNPAAKVILLDDGFQHRYVKADINILLTDYHRLFCDDELLPAGLLRESANGKKRAHIVIVTKCPKDMKPITYNIIAKKLALYPYQSLFFSTFKYGPLTPVFTREGMNSRTLASLGNNHSVLLLTGIASPAPLIHELEKYTQHIDLLTFADHHTFSAKDLELVKTRFKQLKGENKLIITTEKDATRLVTHPALDEGLKRHLYTLPIEIEFLQNQQLNFNKRIIDHVRENHRNSKLS